MFGYIIARNWLRPIEYLQAKVYIRCMRQAVSDNSLICDFDNELQVMLKWEGSISGFTAMGIKVKVTRELVSLLSNEISWTSRNYET